MINNEVNLNEYVSVDNEPNRLKIEKIEHLEEESNKYKSSAITYGITAGIWGLCAIINSTRLFTENDPSLLLELAFGLDLICSGLYIKSSIKNYNSMKETDKEINKIKGFSI